MDEQGIMALPQGMQAPTAQPSMGGLPPEVLMAFERARGTRTSEQISSDAINAMQEADPRLVAELKRALQGMNLPFEMLDALGQLVDAVLANPQDYQEIRADLLSDPETADMLSEFLPPEFDPALFAGLNVALDQLAMNVTSPQGFANGGIASISPVAAGLARMGRRGDTMMAHITPAEARMLKMRGGAGTINPVTGMPEFFLKKAFKSVTNAVKKVVKGVSSAVKSVVKGIGSVVKKIASSTIGRIALTAAAMYFGGPIVAKFLGSSMAAFAPAVTAGLTNTAIGLANGESFGNALKQGVIAGAVVYGGQQLMGAIGGTQAPAPIENASLYDPVSGTTIPQGFTGVVPQDLAAAANIAPATTAAAAPPPGVPAGMDLQAGVDYSLSPSQAMPDYMTSTAAVPSASASPLGTGISLPGQYTSPSYASTVLPTPTAATTAATAGKASAFEELVNAGKNLYDGEYASAAGNVGRALFGSPLRTGATMLAGTYLSGGFNPQQEEPPGLVPSETGFDLISQNPEIYGTAPGGAETVYFPYPTLNTAMELPPMYRGGIEFRPPQYPTFAANGGEISRYAAGGIASVAPQARRPVGRPGATTQGILGLSGGGSPKNFPRKTGQISGPGTEKSDDIPAMLSDGEFVMTARAVRGAGGGSRREGAKRMYALMHSLERKA
jgi:hypothetical protein